MIRHDHADPTGEGPEEREGSQERRLMVQSHSITSLHDDMDFPRAVTQCVGRMKSVKTNQHGFLSIIFASFSSKEFWKFEAIIESLQLLSVSKSKVTRNLLACKGLRILRYRGSGPTSIACSSDSSSRASPK
eukprot:scaffold1389_cov251-Ochromonas_danica.AAC.22